MVFRTLTAAALLAFVAAPASAQISSNPRLLAPFKSVVTTASESTVRVRCDDKDVALGTVVDKGGYILTKASEVFLPVVDEARGMISVRFSDGTEFEAKIVATHIPADLAMLKVDLKDLKPVEFVDSDKVAIGNWLASPGPSSDPLAVGIVSHGTRKLTFPDTVIINENRGFLGVIPVDEKDDDGKVFGAKLETVDEKGGAHKAGLKKDDIIIELNGHATEGHEILRGILENLRPGDTVRLKVLREGEEKEFKVTLTEQLQKSRGDIQNAMGGALSGRRTGFPPIMQTDMVVKPTDCGGPVVDLKGNVLGINIARAGRVETWILPSEQIRPLISDLKAGKSTAKP